MTGTPICRPRVRRSGASRRMCPSRATGTMRATSSHGARTYRSRARRTRISWRRCATRAQRSCRLRPTMPSPRCSRIRGSRSRWAATRQWQWRWATSSSKSIMWTRPFPSSLSTRGSIRTSRSSCASRRKRTALTSPGVCSPRATWDATRSTRTSAITWWTTRRARSSSRTARSASVGQRRRSGTSARRTATRVRRSARASPSGMTRRGRLRCSCRTSATTAGSAR